MVDLNGIIDLDEIPLPEQEERLASSQPSQPPQQQQQQHRRGRASQQQQQVPLPTSPPPPSPPTAPKDPPTSKSRAEEEERKMIEKVMGFSQFDSTKGKPVPGNNIGAVHVVKKRRYRQYMNRRGGFNRPLDKVA